MNNDFQYAKFYFKGGLIIIGKSKESVVIYNEHLTDHPTTIRITPLESIWTGNIHIFTTEPVYFALWDLKKVVLVEDYLSSESKVKTFLTVKENPKRFYPYWKSVAKRLRKLL